MSKPRRTLFLISLAGLLCACATARGPAFSYNEIVILNQSSTPVLDVVIAATESERVFSCGNIAPRGICSNKFPAQPYRGSPIRIAWVFGNAPRRSEIIELTLPSGFAPGIPLRGVLVFDARGAISAYLQQEAPGPQR